MSELVNLISNCGFPIAMCLIMSWYVKTLNETMTNTINKLCSKIDELVILIRKEEKGE